MTKKPVTVMSPFEFERRMKICFDGNNGSVEDNHMDADEIMKEVLVQLGYKAGIKIFKNGTKWYV